MSWNISVSIERVSAEAQAISVFLDSAFDSFLLFRWCINEKAVAPMPVRNASHIRIIPRFKVSPSFLRSPHCTAFFKFFLERELFLVVKLIFGKFLILIQFIQRELVVVQFLEFQFREFQFELIEFFLAKLQLGQFSLELVEFFEREFFEFFQFLKFFIELLELVSLVG